MRYSIHCPILGGSFKRGSTVQQELMFRYLQFEDICAEWYRQWWDSSFSTSRTIRVASSWIQKNHHFNIHRNLCRVI